MEPVEVGRADDGPEEVQERFSRAIDVASRLLDNIETVVYGKREELKLVVAALMCGGHVLLEDVPGTAKTVLARAIGANLLREDAYAANARKSLAGRSCQPG